MATRSTIALEFADGTVQQVYCHSDGYLSFNGKILQKHYSDPFKLRELIDLGDMSSLGPEIGVQHSFDNPHKYGTAEYFAEQVRLRDFTTFYGRDRGETDVEARRFKNYEDYRQSAQFEEYNYILRRDGKWYVEYHDDSEFRLLTEAIAIEVQEEEE
jgi:hypothetical protein